MIYTKINYRTLDVNSSKRIAKNSAMLYFRMFIMMAISLYTSRVLLQNLGIENFGIYAVVGSIAAIFTFLSEAFIEATQRFLLIEIGRGDTKSINKVFIDCINVHLMISFCVIILCETIGLWWLYNKLNIPEARFDAALWCYQFSVITIVIRIMSLPYNAVIIAYEKMDVFAYVSLIESFLKLAIAYVISIILWDKLIVYAILFCIAQIILRCIYGIYCFNKFEVTHYSFSFNKLSIFNIGKFAFWYLSHYISLAMNVQGSKVLLNMFGGPIANAAYGIGEQVNTALTQFRSNIQMAINPQITKSYSVNNINNMRSLINISTRYSFYILWIILLPILLQTKFILNLWLGEVPEHSVAFVRLLAMVAIINALDNPMIVSIAAIGRLKKVVSLTSCLSILAIPISYILLRHGWVIETVVQVILFTTITVYVIHIVFMKINIGLNIIKFITSSLFPILLIIFTTFYPTYLLSRTLSEHFTSFTIITFASLSFNCIAIFTIGLKRSEQNKLIDIFIKIYHKCIILIKNIL